MNKDILKRYSGYVGPKEGYPGKRGLFGLNPEYREYKKAHASLEEVRRNAEHCIPWLQDAVYVKREWPLSQNIFSETWDRVVLSLGTYGVYADSNLSYFANEARWCYAPGWDQSVKVSELDGPDSAHLIRTGLGFERYGDDDFEVRRQYFQNNFKPRLLSFVSAIAVANKVSASRGFSFDESLDSVKMTGFDFDAFQKGVKEGRHPDLSGYRAAERKRITEKDRKAALACLHAFSRDDKRIIKREKATIGTPGRSS